MQNPKKWRTFENIVSEVYRDFSPEAVVKSPEKIKGKSGRSREIDITIRQTVGTCEILIAIDCKDFSKKINIKKVEECIGLFDDIGAHQGVIVSAKGFTDSALKRVKDRNINLYTLIDSGNHDWKSNVKVKFLIYIYTLTARQYIFSCANSNPLVLPLDGYDDIDIFSKERIFLGKLGDLFKENWIDLIELEEGIPTGDFIGQPVTIKCDDVFCCVNITANIEIQEEVYLCDLPVSKISGFRDEINGSIMAKGFTLEEFGLEEIRKLGKVVNRLDEIKGIEKFATMRFFLLPNLGEKASSQRT